jgi:hypothetical protein
MPVAVGTSLVVIAMKSFAGFAGYLHTVTINWGLAAAVTLAAVAGSLIGAKLAGRIPADTLRKSFGWFVVVMGLFVLAQQLPAHLRTSPVLWAVTAATAVAAAAAIAVWRRRHHSEPVPSALQVRSTPQPGAPMNGAARRSAGPSVNGTTRHAINNQEATP